VWYKIIDEVCIVPLQEVGEAIECHLEGILADEGPAPLPQTIEFHQANPDYVDGVWAVVSVDLSKLSGKTRRVNITLPERVLTMMDKYATEHGETRFRLIAQAAVEYITARKRAGGQVRL
jgi:hypothetical protein